MKAIRTQTVVAPDVPLTIGELARRSGIAASALRHYEAVGLIGSVRSEGNHRRFVRGTLRRVAFIRAAHAVGITLGEIRVALATLPEARTPTATDWQRLARHWRPRLDERIAALERMRDQLDACIGCGCLSLARCALYNPGDAAARLGPGARYWLGDRSADALKRAAMAGKAPLRPAAVRK